MCPTFTNPMSSGGVRRAGLPRRSSPFSSDDQRRRGFTLVELLVVAALMATVMAIAIPSFGISDRMRLDAAAREIQQELQGARLRAVNVNRRLEIRFNCPVAGQFRVVEGGWPESGRCDVSTYPSRRPPTPPTGCRRCRGTTGRSATSTRA